MPGPSEPRDGEQAVTINVVMGERWLPHFLGMLRAMENLGRVGSSQMLCFFADGDGDFRPRFEWDAEVEPVGPSVEPATWDAG